MSNILGFLLINIYAFLIIISTCIIFFKKKRSKQFEDETYKRFLIANVFISLSGLILGLAVNPRFHCNKIIIIFLNKVYLICLILWIAIMTYYFMHISLNDKLNDKKARKAFIIIEAISVILVLILPINVNISDTGAIATGPAIMFTYTMFAIGFIAQVVFSLINHKHMLDRKYIPLYLLIVMGAVVVLLMVLNPNLNYIINPVFIFIAFIMFHTIENPDMQMIDTLLRNKELVEETVNDKSNFLFKVSQEMKKPVQNILDYARSYHEAKTDEEKEAIMELIEQDANAAYFIINDITNVSSTDFKKLKVKTSEYITKKLFVDIETNIKNKLSVEGKDKDISFNLKTYNSYPEKLWGDYIKLKQVIISLISNGIKHTEKGFVDVEVDTVSRYDTCRMIFTIKDSGPGMSISRVNKLLSSNEEMSLEEFEKIDSLELEFPVVIKIIRMLGGSISIKTEEGKGTIVVVVIDQKIGDTADSIDTKNSKKYSSSIKSQKRVLIANDNNELLEKEGRIVSRKGAETVLTLMGQDVIDKINSGDKYNLIILKDEMKPDSAFSILKKLKEDNKFNTPVVISITKDKEFIKDHFINDGFADCILEENIDDELNKICDKYL
jgi:signal transduction histidine kinase